MTPETEQQYKNQILQLQAEIEKLKKDKTIKMKSEKYGLNWIDVPEAFDAESENKIPILEEVKEKAIKNDDGKPTHILIEGDNYHALTCLNYTHAGKIDVIYIDPPYNTGKKDQGIFVYNDSRYLIEYPNGKAIEKDDPLKHSSWLSFMEKRLHLSYSLLSNIGIIFISIDDNEQANLKLLCNRIFGESNFLGQLIIETATDNNPSQINTEHEYMICYAKNKEIQKPWKIKSNKAILIQNKYKSLLKNNYSIDILQSKLRDWIKENKKDLREVAHYNNVDDKGVYSSSSNSSNTKPGGYTFDIIHPITHKVCAKPEFGWRWKEETFNKYKMLDEVEWGIDETTQPHIKKRIETATEQLKSLIYEDGRKSTKLLQNIFAQKKIFNNPKSINILSKLENFSSNKDSIVLDFFAGSGTTLHATMNLNEEDGGHRQCILVQSPEKTYEIKNEKEVPKKGSENAYKNGYKKISDITYERNRRVMQGYTNLKGEEIAGLGNSLKYYKTSFVGKNNPSNATDSDRITLAQKAGCLISLTENTLDEIETTDFYQIYTDGKRYTGVYFNLNCIKLQEFVKKIEDFKAPSTVYIFSWGSPEIFENEFDDMTNITIKSIPQPILEIYKSLNGDN